MSSSRPLPALTVAAMGVVFGDIGTSPLYALKEIFSGHHPIAVNPGNIYGILSLVFWAIMVLVTLKYVLIIMRADNRGEGGSLSLLALVVGTLQSKRLTWLVWILGMLAAALFFGDSMITPAISVLSAVEGITVVAPALGSWVVPVTVVILTALFAIQRNGTGSVGLLFGPIMVGWFGVLAVLGLGEIVQHPDVLRALNPAYAVAFAADHGVIAFLALGAVVLAVTGGEALYTDMGHFGPLPIRVAWFGVVMPALVLNYFGQGALLLRDPAAIENPFYHLGPSWAMIPMLVLATLATVIASQAVISGTFSVARQAIQMGLLPRMLIVHTSGREAGQIYVPFTNITLYLAVLALVLGFQSSSALAAAYGIAVTGTMLIDTILVAFVMLKLWRWNRAGVALLIGTLVVIDVAFFSANALKIGQGGWFPLVVALVTLGVLTSWREGRRLVNEEIHDTALSVQDFVDMVEDVHRVSGTAVFMTSTTEGVPSALLHNLKHNQVLHQRVVLLTVQTAETPYVNDADRVQLERLDRGFLRIVVQYGFMEDPDVPAALELCQRFGETFDMMRTTFYLSRETVIPDLRHSRFATWRAKLFAFMAKNATSAMDYFRIPTNRVVELGTQLVI